MRVSDEELEYYGYYAVEDYKFFNKYEAMELAFKVSKPISFHFNDTFWNAQDWTKPSPRSLKDLYKERAQKLREKYDYIVLCYSGGADSWNVLQAFGDSDTHLDEIVSWHDYSLSKDKDSKTNAEIFRVAIPETEEFLKTHPKTIYRQVDIKDSVLDTFTNMDSDERFLSYYQSSTSIASPIRGSSWVYTIPEYKKLIDKGKKVCILYGYDKVVLGIHKNRYYFRFHDLTMKSTRKKFLKPELPFHDEFFYWSPDMPELVITQCHEVKTRLNTLPLKYIDPFPVQRVRDKICYIISKNNNIVSLETLNNWLYGWDSKTFTVGKPPSTYFFSELDYWAKNYLNEDIVKTWLKDLERCLGYYRRVRKEHKDEHNMNFGFSPVMNTKRYYIE